MRPAPVHVLITVDFPESFLDRLRAVDPRLVIDHYPWSEDEAAPPSVPADVLARAEVMYTSAVLPGPQQAPSLRWAQLDTSGVDHLRGTGLWDGDCLVTTLGGVSPAPLAEWVIMIVLAHAHHFRETERLARESHWPTREYRWNVLMPKDLRRSTIGIVGYGRIGAQVARTARTLGMRVLALRSGRSQVGPRFGDHSAVDGVELLGAEGLDELLRASDYVVLTVPLTPDTEGMIGAAQLSVMREDAVLINGSRGGVVDEDALLSALDAGHLDLVASDVFTTEPLPAGHPFWQHPRVVVTPHVAGFAPDYLDAVGRLFGENLRRYLDGDPLLNLADRARGY